MIDLKKNDFWDIYNVLKSKRVAASKANGGEPRPSVGKVMTSVFWDYTDYWNKNLTKSGFHRLWKGTKFDVKDRILFKGSGIPL